MKKTNHSIFLNLLEGYMSVYLPVSIGLSKNTITSYKCTFRLLLKFFMEKKNLPADKVTFQALDFDTLMEFFTWLKTERSCSAATQNQRLAALGSFSKYAQNRNFEAASVFRSSVLAISLKRTHYKPRSYFTSKELKIIFDLPDINTVTGYRDLVLLSLMYACGARAQEICDLKVRDISNDDEGIVLTITGKGNKMRRCRIGSEASKMLSDYISYRKIQKNPDRHVFSSQTHEQMTVSCVEGIYKKYVRKAKMDNPTLFPAESYPPHSMRHTTATHMLAAGVPMVVIKNFLGHASLMSTQVYAEMLQGSIDDHLKAWNEKWFSGDLGNNPQENDENSLPDFLK